MKQKFWLSLIFFFCFAHLQDLTAQCKNGKCDFECDSGEKGSLRYSFALFRDGASIEVKDGKLDLSKAKTANSYLRVVINNIVWAKGNGTIRITNTHINNSVGFKEPKILNSGTSTIEISYYIDPNHKQDCPTSIDIEFVPYKVTGGNCANTPVYRIKKTFNLIPPKNLTQVTEKTTTNTTTGTEPTGSKITNVDHIKNLIAIINSGNKDETLKNDLKSACDNEFKNSTRKSEWERFLEGGELYGCVLCGKPFNEEAKKLLPEDDGGQASTPTGTTPTGTTSTGTTSTGTTGAGTTPAATKIEAPPISEPRAWEKANRNGGSVRSYEEYLKSFRNGPHANEANRQIATILEKDRIACNELENEIKNAASICSLKLVAYDRYLKKEPIGHFTKMRETAGREKKSLFKICGRDIVGLVGETTREEGELRLTYFNKNATNQENVKISISQRDKELVAGEDFFLDPITSTTPGQFEWLIKELEGGETKVKIETQGVTTVESFALPSRMPKLKLIELNKYRVIGGELPLSLIIYRNGIKQSAKPPLTSRLLDVSTSEYFKESGRYSIMVIDYTDAKIGEAEFSVGTDYSLIGWLIAVAGLASLVLLVMAFRTQIMRWMRSKPALRNLFNLKSPEAALREHGQEGGAKVLHEQGSIKVRSQQILQAQAEERKSTGKIVIKKTDGQQPAITGGGVAGLPAFMESDKYMEFDLKSLWGDTTVQKVFMRIDAAAELDNQLHELAYRMDKQSVEGAQPHPEIGGFLLGQHFKSEQGHYVSLEKYVEAPTEKQDAYEIEFGQEAFTRLDEVKEMHRDLELVGWFHTHPGHGCFLSTPDQKIQGGFFREPYQMAFQIDTLSEKMDFAIYSWQHNGSINNAKDKIASDWFSWEKVKNWRKDVAKRLL